MALAELAVKFWEKWRLASEERRASSGISTTNAKSTVTCLRSVLMKPEHLEWVGRIVELLTRRVARYIRVEFWSWW